jgi:HAD superfamily hydrolase (TIGR01509 family)
MTIRGIFFDAADVLYRRPVPTSEYVSRLLAERGYSPMLSAQDWTRQRALRSQAKSGRLGPDAYWDKRLQMHGVVNPEVRKELGSMISDYSDRVQPVLGGRDALAALKQRGFVLGVVTDTIYPCDRKKRWLDAIGVGEFVDVLACSTALGLHKPEPAIYLRAVQEAGLTPSESAFVGHAADELEGARQAGLVTVAVYHDPHAMADYYAASLLDMLNVPIFQPIDTERPDA